MVKKVTDIDKLKHWLDAEISILHFMFAVVLMQGATNGWIIALLVVYMIWSLLYALVRLMFLVEHDPDYLKVVKK